MWIFTDNVSRTSCRNDIFKGGHWFYIDVVWEKKKYIVLGINYSLKEKNKMNNRDKLRTPLKPLFT